MECACKQNIRRLHNRHRGFGGGAPDKGGLSARQSHSKLNIRRLHNLPSPLANRTPADCTLWGVGCNPTKGDSPPEPFQTERFFCLKYAARSGFARSERGSVLLYVTERATPARPEIAHNSGKKKWRRGSESNRSKRFCRPLPSRLATTPRDMLHKITPKTGFVNP